MLHALRSLTHCCVLSLACAISVTGCKRSAAEVTDAGPSDKPVDVTVATVSELEVPTTLRISGTLRGNQETDLAANASGRVIATLVERGNEVTPNQVLARLDVRAAALSAAEARAQADTVSAQEDNARRECARYEQLKAKGAVSDFEYERVVDQCRTLPLSKQAASARARLAAQNVGDGVIRAPFAGVVSERYVEIGQYVRQDTRVVSIASLDPLRLELSVPEAEVGRVKLGAEVSFQVAAYPDRRYHGKVRYVAGALRQTTRDLVVEALVDNPDKTLLPGMFADVELTTGTQRLPSVPKTALVTREGQAHAYFVVEGRAEERILALGPLVADRVSVQKGARIGEQVIINPGEALANGQRVR